MLTPDGAVPTSLVQKLSVLAQHEAMRVVAVSSRADTVREALAGVPHLIIASSIAGLPGGRGPTLAILGERASLSSDVHAWYVGTGGPLPGFHPTRHTGARASDEILALIGTALVQERAGIAFRAAGAGQEIPRAAPFDPKILDGITAAVDDHPKQVERLERKESSHGDLDLDGDTDRLIAAALPPILACQDESGAVAAAPRPTGPDQPNYWFFWQRDAGQVVLAMTEVARGSSDSSARRAARAFAARYVDFVERLPHLDGTETADLGASRFEVSGKPIRGYGDPQKDGPAHTVLATIAALGSTARAYTVTGPYLEYLSEHILGPSFDPWEFAVGDIFFDYNLARRALRAGAVLARAQGDDAAAQRYDTTAEELERALQAFRAPAREYILAGQHFLQPFLNTISRLDVDVVGSVLTAYDVQDPVLTVDDPLIEGTMHALEHVFAERWPVNVAWRETGHGGMGMGRFPEDANDGIGSTGGNPWTFATLWAAQYYLRLVQRRDFLRTGYQEGHDRGELLHRADGYLRFVLDHVPPEALTEQIDGWSGAPRGAKKLAWAQAALIQTLLLRRTVRTT